MLPECTRALVRKAQEQSVGTLEHGLHDLRFTSMQSRNVCGFVCSAWKGVEPRGPTQHFLPYSDCSKSAKTVLIISLLCTLTCLPTVQDDLEDMRCVIAYLRNTYGYRIELLVGHSRGALDSFSYLSRHGHTPESEIPYYVSLSARWRMHVSIRIGGLKGTHLSARIVAS